MSTKKLKDIQIEYGDLILKFKVGYYSNGRLLITLKTLDGLLYNSLTMNFKEEKLFDEEREIIVRSWDLPDELLAELLNSGCFEDTKRRFKSFLGICEIWKIKDSVELGINPFLSLNQ